MSNIKKKIGKFIFRKFDEFWLSDFEFNQNETSFEIYQETFNEELIHKILTELNGELLNVNKEGVYLLSILSEIFWGHDRNNVFQFSGFVIDNEISQRFIDFRMCYHCTGEDNFSDFANWFIDIKDFKIVGCIRQQL